MASKKLASVTPEARAETIASLVASTAIVVEGKPYRLVLTHGCYIEIERLTGISTILEADKIFDRPSRTTLSAAFYVLLKAAGAKYTLDQVQNMVSGRNTLPIFNAVLSAHAVAQMEEDDVPLVTAPLPI